MLADERRLVAPGKRVDDPGLLRFAREQGAGHHVCLHIDHDNVLAVVDRLEAMGDAGVRIARGVDHDLHRRMRDERRDVVAEERGRAAGGRVQARGGELRLRPPGQRAGGARPRDVEVGDPDDVHPCGQARLRQVHGAEFSGADQAYSDRAPLLLPARQHAIEIHASTPYSTSAAAVTKAAAPPVGQDATISRDRARAACARLWRASTGA